MFALGMLFTCNAFAAKAKVAVLVIPSNEVQDTELNETKAALEKAGITVVLAAPAVAPVKGMLGGSFTPDITFSAIDPAKADMIVCIGGNGSMGLYDDAGLRASIQAFQKQGKVVAAICAAPGILANAGVLKGLSATCYPYDPIIKLLKDGGAQYTEKSVVVSGKVVTANGEAASAAFGAQLASMLR